MPYIDAHLHIVPDEVFLRAREKGVEMFFVNATHEGDWKEVLGLSERILGVYPCLGIHPWYVDNASEHWEEALMYLLRKNPLAMVGEIGLDATRTNYAQQIEMFYRQLEIATQLDRSVHIHCVRAWDDMLRIMGEFKNLQFLIHRFSGDEVLVQKFRMMNAFFSVLDDKVIGVIPDNRLLIESDAPNGLKTPEAIPEFAEKLKLDMGFLGQTAELFLNGR